MSRIAGDPSRYAAMSLAAMKAVTEKFNLRETVVALEGYYREAIELRNRDADRGGR